MTVLKVKYKSEINMKSNGFTLAEILITLAIIGVVATLTIPGTIKNYRNRILTTQLQNTINLIATAISNSMNDNATEDFYNLASTKDLCINFLETYFDTVNICDGTTSSINNCLAPTYSNFDKSMQNKNINQLIGPNMVNVVCANTTSGATICIGGKTKQSGEGAEFLIDQNGQEAPNVLGKDLFWFWVKENGKLSYSIAEHQNAQDMAAKRSNEAAGNTCLASSTNFRSNVCLPYIISHGWTFKF